MATHSSILAWKIPWTESLVGYSPRVHKELNVTKQSAHESKFNTFSIVFSILNIQYSVVSYSL